MKKSFRILLKSIAGIVLLAGVVYLGAVIDRAATKPGAGSAEAILEEADQKAWSTIGKEPLRFIGRQSSCL